MFQKDKGDYNYFSIQILNYGHFDSFFKLHIKPDSRKDGKHSGIAFFSFSGILRGMKDGMGVEVKSSQKLLAEFFNQPGIAVMFSTLEQRTVVDIVKNTGDSQNIYKNIKFSHSCFKIITFNLKMGVQNGNDKKMITAQVLKFWQNFLFRTPILE